MKKIIVSVATVLTLGVGGVLAAGSLGGEETKTASKNEVVKTSTEEEIKVEAPTERTIELTAGATYPWEGASVDEGQAINEGEVVYLRSDLPAFEEIFPKIIDIDIIGNEGDPKILKTRVDQITTQLIPYGPEEYFLKLTEAADLVVAGSYEEAKTKIEEAKTIRESE